MRTEQEVNEFKHVARQRLLHGCKKCFGEDVDCGCYRKTNIVISAYEAGVPKDFWDIHAADVSHNKKVFKAVIQKYTDNLNKVLKNGYGLVLVGDNGVGKSYFLSYVLMAAIRLGRTAYYTTLPQLIHDIKKGFNDPVYEKRLDWYLTSDFLAIDEMGKEKFRSKEDYTFMDTQVERILKQRFDDAMPTLLATNMNQEDMNRTYGSTIGSIMAGKYKSAVLKSGDFRTKLAQKMDKEMGY